MDQLEKLKNKLLKVLFKHADILTIDNCIELLEYYNIFILVLDCENISKKIDILDYNLNNKVISWQKFEHLETIKEICE